ncbi:hypothetical protein BY458DRAFT_458544 [Sporodiniella umbellata]|nr:hypothetical protein BY458DRAFT_458544 [Sporodiniella umbellata]
MHRDENLIYIKENKIRIGDLVGVDGVFMAEAKPGSIYYIKVFSLRLLQASNKKKRTRIEETSRDILTQIENRLQQKLRISLVPKANKLRPNAGFYQEFIGSFSEYFFMLYGKVALVTMSPEKMAERERMLTVMSKIYDLFGDMTTLGLNDYKLSEFVNTVTELTYKISAIRDTVQVPPGLVLDHLVPLPTVVYANFIKE